MRIAIVIACVALAGCAASPERLAAQDHQKCVDLDFTPGTEGYGNCRLQLESIRAQNRAARISAFSGIMAGQRNIRAPFYGAR